MKCRWAILCALLWLLVLVAGDGWLLARTGFMHDRVEALLHETFVSRVTFEDLHLVPFDDIVFTDVRMMRPDRDAEVYGTIDEIRVRIDWQDLFWSRRLVVDEIIVRTPRVNVSWGKDAAFDMPSPIRPDLERKTHRPAGELPVLRLTGLSVMLRNAPHVMRPNQELAFPDLSLVLSPEGSEKWLYRFEVDADNALMGRVHARGRFSDSDFILSIRRPGFIDAKALARAVLPEFGTFLQELHVEGDLELGADVARDPATGEFFGAEMRCNGVSARGSRWPQELTDLRGTIHYKKGRLWSEELTGRIEGALLECGGFVDFGSVPEMANVTGQLRRLHLSDEFGTRLKSLPDPCTTVGEQVQSWSPDGYADLKFRVEQKRDAAGGRGPVRPFIDLEFHGGTTVKYVGQMKEDQQRHGFAYPLEDVRGTLHFDDLGMHFDRVTATNGTLLVEARGTIDYERANDEAYDIDIAALGMTLGDRVMHALHGDGQELYKSLDAEGQVNLFVSVKRKKSEPPGARLEVAVEPQGISARPLAFPLPLEDARGRIVISHDDVIHIDDLHARYRGGDLRLSGQLGVAENGGDLSLKLGFDKFPLDSNMIAALRAPAPAAAAQIDHLNARGVFSGNVTVTKRSDRTAADVKGLVRFEKVSLAPEDPSVRIDNLDGIAEVTSNSVVIKPGTTGTLSGEKFAVDGKIADSSGIDLTIEAERFNLNRNLIADLEPLVPWLREVHNRFGLEGPMSAKIKLHGPPDQLVMEGNVDFIDLVARPAGLPNVRIENLRGQCRVAPDGVVSFRGLTAWIPPPGTASAPSSAPTTRPEGPFEAERRIAIEIREATWTPNPRELRSPHGQIMLGPVFVRRLPLEPWFFDLLPLSAEQRAKVDQLSLHGVLDLTFGNITYDADRVYASGCQLKGWKLVQGTQERLRADYIEVQKFNATVENGELTVSGRLVLDGGNFFRIPVPHLTGKLGISNDTLHITTIDADLIGYDRDEKGGRVAAGKIDSEQSRVEIRLGDGGFQTRVDLRDVNLPAVVHALGADPGKVRGLLRGTFELGGIADTPATYSGKGELNANARNVIDLPVFYKLFNQLDLISVFTGGDGRTTMKLGINVKDRSVGLPKIRIDAPELALDGSGSISFEGIVHADLKASQKVGLSPIGWITDLISAVVFAGVTIDGPIEDPEVGTYSIGGSDQDPTDGRRPKLKPVKQ